MSLDSPAAPRFSILITSFRSLRYLPECLGSLLDLRPADYEVLFLDNGSPDPEAQWVRENIRDPRFRVFRVEETRYFAGGVNYLAARASGEFLVLLNSDARVDPAWLETLDAYLRRTGYEAAGSDVFQEAEPELRPDMRWTMDALGLVHFLPGESGSPGRIFTAGGCGMAVRRDIFADLGALDEDFKMYFEEVDFCWRMNLRGYRIGRATGAIVHHVGQGSAARKPAFDWNRFRGRRNRIWSYVKNAGPGMLAVFLVFHPLISLARIGAGVLRGRFHAAWAETAALAAAFWHLRIPLSKRGAIQKSRARTDGDLAREGFFVGPRYYARRLLGR
jgi:GT2 family glycosyltransferase